MRQVAARISFIGLLLASAPVPAFAQADDFEFDVDLELVLAVDVSRSMDVTEQRVQREGYIAAFRHPDVIEAIASGPLGKIAVTYFEWAGPGHRTIVVPWRLVGSAGEGEEFAALLEGSGQNRQSGTSISGAILQAGGLFGRAYTGYRQAVDISGDGPNNSGRPVLEARNWLLNRGVTINGLPIMLNRVYGFGAFGIPNLDAYYEDCVIGGPGAFIVPVRSPDEFAEAIRRKLILEIAGLPPRIMLAQQIEEEAGPVDCLIGEKSRRGRFDWEVPPSSTPGRR
jgi:hypothetical protein